MKGRRGVAELDSDRNEYARRRGTAQRGGSYGNRGIVQALILAAGRGTRLGLADGEPKCLVRVGRLPLLDAYLDALDRLNIPATVVVGHQASQIADHVAARRAAPTLVINPRFAEGSILSLATGLACVSGDLLLLDGDVAFDPRLLDRLAAHDGDALLVDVGTRFTDEQYMTGIAAGCVAALRRGPADGFDEQGEWIGFAKLRAASAAALSAGIDRRIAVGATAGGYEDELAALCVESGNVAVLPTGGLPWVEIDFPADLERARSIFPASRS